jgi:hypothetical protein
MTRRMLAVALCAFLATAAVTAAQAAETRFVAGATNIAAADQGGKVISSSSQAVDANGKTLPHWQPSNLIDGKFVIGEAVPPDSYGWSTSKAPSDTEPQWVIFAFANEQTRLISRIAIDPTTADPSFIGRWAKNFEIQVSNTTKEGPWKNVGRFELVNKPIKQSFDFPPVEARYVKLLITTNQGSDRCVEMGEFEAYEAIVGDDSLDQVIIRLENLLNDLKHYRDGTLYKANRENLEKAGTKPPAPPGAVANPAGANPTPPTAPGPAGPAKPDNG